MGFNSGDVSNQQTKRALPKLQTALKSRKRCDQFKDGLGGYNANLAYTHRKKDTADSAPEPEDLEQLNSIEWFSDYSDFMWLSPSVSPLQCSALMIHRIVSGISLSMSNSRQCYHFPKTVILYLMNLGSVL